MKALERVERDSLKKKVPEFSVGDTVKVHVKVVEGQKVRNQVFQGTVIGRRGGGVQETFVVRKISANIAVERIFPLHSPNVVKIELVRRGRVRRAQLTYLRDRKGKRARVSGLRNEAEVIAREKVAAKAAAEAEAKEKAKADAKAKVKADAEAKAAAEAEAANAEASAPDAQDTEEPAKTE